MINLRSYYIKLFLTLYKKFTNALILKNNNRNSLYILIDKQFLFPLLNILKNSSITKFTVMSDICVIDNPQNVNRFELSYNLLSVKYNFRLFIKTHTSAYVNSICRIYASSNWIERECWDMFGIFFIDHPDLRRILTDYGFEGFPLRKDFPLTGYIEVRYDDEKANIVYEPLELSQEYRLFNFTSPWEKIK